MPTVSVISAFHRVLPYLRTMVESVRAQTLEDWELLLVDNGTGKGLASLGSELARDPRIRVLSLPENRGASFARNLGIRESRGEFVAMLDYDDVARPTRLAKQVAWLRGESSLGLVASAADAIGPDGRVLRAEFTLGESAAQQVFSAYTMPGVMSSYTGRRSVFLELPFRTQLDFAEDFDFLSRAAEKCRIGCVPETLLEYRTYGGQTSQVSYPSQVVGANMVRLMTARRRAGHNEDMEGLIVELGAQMKNPPSPARSCLEFSDRALTERFPLLGVYLGRRHVGYARTAAAFGRATRRLVRALRLAPSHAPMLVGMFLGGPLRVHGLRPLRRTAANRER